MSDASGLVASGFEQRVREAESRLLSPLAVQSYATAGRARPLDEDCSVRTPFQIDRDRIAHSKAFRRLAYKTQVFISPLGDHYRTRLTHTLEVTAISRVVARALRLNEDLTEAIGYGHDLGHPPFGHTGEHALDAALQQRFGRRFLHNEHSVRMVEVLEKGGRGLNLTVEVRDGIRCHTGPELSQTLEGRIVRLVDRIAYINHDIDDALRAGVLSWKDLPGDAIGLLGETGSERIDRLVHDMIENSERQADIVQSEELGTAMLDLRSFMFEHVYLGSVGSRDKQRIADLIPRLVDYYTENPGALPPARADEDDLPQRITDWIAGMTDRYCLRLLRDLFLPREWE